MRIHCTIVENITRGNNNYCGYESQVARCKKVGGPKISMSHAVATHILTIFIAYLQAALTDAVLSRCTF